MVVKRKAKEKKIKGTKKIRKKLYEIRRREREKIKKYNKKLINSVNYFIISLLKKKKKKELTIIYFLGVFSTLFHVPLFQLY